MCIPTHTHNQTHRRSIHHTRWKSISNISHSPLKRGCPSSVESGNSTLYTSSVKPGLHGGVPLPSAAICGGVEIVGVGWGTQKWVINQALKMHSVASTNLLVTFWSPHSCTKASVVFIAGTAIRIMRPKGLSISQKAWLGKNKRHLSPQRGPDTG